MAYTYTDGVNPLYPDGSAVNAADIDTVIQNVIKAMNERLSGVFGVTWATDDPILPTLLGPKIIISGGQVRTAIFDAGNSGASLDIDWDDGDQQKVTLTANATLTFSSVKVGAVYTLWIVQDGTGGWDLTLPTACKQGTAAFSTAFLDQTLSTLTGLTITVYNSATFITGVITTGSSVS